MDTSQTTLYHAILITSVILFLVFGYFIYTIFRSHHRYYTVLRKHMVDQVNLLERERTRIAYNMHDDLGPLLALIKIQVGVAGDTVTINKELIDKACVNLDHLHERMSGIAQDLSSSFLKRKGLAATLQDYFEQYGELVSIKIQLLSELQTKIDDDTELQLFRMIQELVHNAVKHSGAKLISVHMRERKKKLYIHCTDNGIGIHKNEWKSIKKGIGLESLRYRVEIMGGRLRFSFRKGTEYLFEIPLLNKHG